MGGFSPLKSDKWLIGINKRLFKENQNRSKWIKNLNENGIDSKAMKIVGAHWGSKLLWAKMLNWLNWERTSKRYCFNDTRNLGPGSKRGYSKILPSFGSHFIRFHNCRFFPIPSQFLSSLFSSSPLVSLQCFFIF